jgi:hypothetical protein
MHVGLAGRGDLTRTINHVDFHDGKRFDSTPLISLHVVPPCALAPQIACGVRGLFHPMDVAAACCWSGNGRQVWPPWICSAAIEHGGL